MYGLLVGFGLTFDKGQKQPVCRKSIDSMDILDIFHRIDGHCPWNPWNVWTMSMEPMECVDNVHGIQGQCPGYCGHCPWNFSSISS